MNEEILLLLRDLLINLVAIYILVFYLYFKRHHKRDQVTGYLAFNASLFVVAASLGSSTSLTIGVGFGIFAILSIVRLRSSEAAWNEIGYTMVSIVLGLVAGFQNFDFPTKLTLIFILVFTMYIADHPKIYAYEKNIHLKINLDKLILVDNELKNYLEQSLSGSIKKIVIVEIDYLRETMSLDVRMTKIENNA